MGHFTRIVTTMPGLDRKNHDQALLGESCDAQRHQVDVTDTGKRQHTSEIGLRHRCNGNHVKCCHVHRKYIEANLSQFFVLE